MLKKTLIVLAALAVSAPALADRGHREHRAGPHHRGKDVIVQRHVAPRPYYHRHYAPRHVTVVHRPVYYRPQPVYYYHQQSAHPHAGAAIVVGAVLGAVIGHHIASGY